MPSCGEPEYAYKGEVRALAIRLKCLEKLFEKLGGHCSSVHWAMDILNENNDEDEDEEKTEKTEGIEVIEQGIDARIRGVVEPQYDKYELLLEKFARIFSEIFGMLNYSLIDYGFFGGLVRNKDGRAHKDVDCVFFIKPYLPFESEHKIEASDPLGLIPSRIVGNETDVLFWLCFDMKQYLNLIDPAIKLMDIFITDGVIGISLDECKHSSFGKSLVIHKISPKLKGKTKEDIYIGEYKRKLTQ